MAKSIRKLLSICLVLVMLFNMLPLHAFATETEKQPPSDTTGQEAVSSDIYTVEEIIERRTEYTKQFRLSNGLHIATVYASPVHYEVDGQWEEIDNTLQLASTRSGSAYVNTAGVWQVSFPQSMTENNGVTITKDGYVFNFRMAGELLDPNIEDIIVESEIIEIPAATEAPAAGEETVPATEEMLPTEDPTEVPEETVIPEETEATEAAEDPEENATELTAAEDETVETSETEATEAAAEAEQEATEGKNADAEEPEASAPAEEAPAETTEPQDEAVLETVAPEAETQETEPAAEEPAVVSAPEENVTAEIESIDMEEIKAQAEYPETVVEKISSRLTYDGIYEDTDIIFDLNSNQVKESIVLNTYRESLKGYIYALEVGDLTPVLLEGGEIELRDADGEEVVMYMPAPYLIDAAGEYSFDVAIELQNNNDGTYRLCYILPTEWLADESRRWPVILDPAVSAQSTISNVKDQTVYSDTYIDYNDGILQIGYKSNYGIGRAYLMYQNLPVLSSADVIIGASIYMHKPYNSKNHCPIEVHKVLNTWTSSTISWSNKPPYDETIEDYVLCGEAGTYSWDVTDIVRGWYGGSNTGMMFKVDNESETGNDETWKQFYSSDYSNWQVPVMSIIFRNNNGLESYWDYTTSSAGRAGTGYVNQYTGNLVWIRDDIGFGGNRMPVTISHVYNTNDSTENLFGMGYGWRTNFNQRVYHWNEDTAYGDYYVWEDSDGTDHYFLYESSKTYKDEDGLELTLTTGGSGTEEYCIKDKNGNASYFDTYGRLSKQTNNQATKSNITITYTTTSGRLISTITDGAGRVYSFTYTNNLLSKIAYKGKGTSEITYVNFAYTNSNLTSVTDKDSKVSKYTYTTNNLMSSAQDIDGYKINYAYTTTTVGKPNRIKTITEYSGSTAGGVLNIAYAHNQTKFTDYNGNVQIVQFNNMGNTVSIQDDQGRAQYAQYAINDPTKPDDAAAAAARATGTAKGNQLLLASKLQNTVGNVLKDGSFENSTPWTATSTAVTRAIDSTNKYMGGKSLKMVRSSAGTAAGVYSTAFSVASGETYTFSAYVKTGTGAAYLALHDGSTTVVSETLAANSGWSRLEVSYTNTSSAAKSVTARLMTAAAGTTYMDCAQVEKAPTASRYNLIENGDFTHSGYAWNTSTGRTTVTAANKAPAPQLDVNVYKMTGNPKATNRISQTVKVSGASGDTFVLAGWAKADSVPIRDDREFALIATFKKSSTTVNTSTVRFNYCADSTINWQYAASPIVAKGAYDSIVIELAYDYNANTVYFDGVQLYKEEFGNSYTYDEDGNIISVKDVQSQTTSYEYTNNNLTKQILPSGAALTYTYDNYHNVKTATSDTGVVYNFAYDTYGNNTSVSIVSGSVKLTSSATYTSDGNRLASTTDAAGKVTTYSYHENTNVLQWVQYPEDTTATRTEYTYDNMYRLAKAEADISTGITLKAEYGYTNDLLTSIKTGSTTYSFTYGAFALRSNIKIGSRTLASYSYTSRNNFLDTLAYGNGDSVKYAYDKQGRVTKQTYEDGDTVTYKYDNSGALASVRDSATGITSTYYYDYTDRLLRYAEKGSNFSHIIGYEYDEINNLTALVETINGTVHKTNYGYDDDNRVTSVANGSANKGYTYDAYGRVTTKITKNGNTTVLTDTFTYRAPTSVTTSGQVATLKSAASGYNVDYTYTYDDNGNILSVNDGTNTTTYEYDSANQLTRENNKAADKTWVWTYDDAGNILSKKEYAYTTGTLGPVQSTVNYTYDNTWGDLLTGYNGKTITSDNIGNILTYGKQKSYSWEHGRELATLTQATDLGITKQPEDFIGRIGDVVSFSVEARGDNLTYQWQVSGNGTYWSNSSGGGYATPRVYGFELTEARVGNLYRCKITDSAGNVAYSQPGRIIAVPIAIDAQPEDFYGDMGDMISFSVTARGEGLTYQWQLSGSNGTYWNDSSAGGCNTPQIYGFDITEARIGNLYRCKITDGAGNVTYSEPGRICLDGLTIVKQPENFVGQMGDLIQFGIEARGEGLTYQWQLSGSNGTYWNDSSAGGCNTPQIYGFDITEARIGNLYRCKVTDSAGNVVYSEPGKIVLLSETWSYKYNADGLRTSRSNGATTYKYIYNGSSLSQMTVGGNTLYFAYDASGTPMSVTYNGTNYYYATNLQGDVTTILTIGGTAVVRYTYDAWGKLLSTTGPMSKSLGEINPLRYRGYVYDIETGFYYLQSRYYDPSIGRFINADSFASTGQGFLGYNMFAYCGNNPVNNTDPTGHASWGTNTVAIADGYCGFFPGSAEYAIKERNRQKVWKNTLENLVNTDNTDEQVVLDADLLAFYNGRLFLKVKGESGLSFGIVFFGEGIDDPNLVRHEYGHTVQLKKIGLADYIRQVAIPSLCGFLLNENSLLPPGLYYNLPWEYTADVYGGVTWSHMDFADEISALYWFFS